MDHRIRILVVEDDKKISRFLELELIHEEYEVQTVFDGRAALNIIEKTTAVNHFDIVLLDVMLPGINGIEVCRRIRKFSAVPIIMLTAKDGITDRVMGLDSGADDYLTKPFAIEELLARIRALLRRTKEHEDRTQTPSATGVLAFMDIVLDMERHQVTKAGSLVELSKKEFDLLFCLIENKNLVLSREKILEHVWGYDFAGETNIVDVYIRYLRSKIDIPFQSNLIQTVRGVGYTLREGSMTRDLV